MICDFLIIGSGVAGLTPAIKLAERFPEKKVIVITKSDPAESNTRYAQGGIAAVVDIQADSFRQHIEDTLKAGDGLCDPEVVEMVVREGPLRLKELMEWGAQFDSDQLGQLILGKEGGHSQHRIVHHHDSTGREIERTLLTNCEKLPNVTMLPHHFSLDLLTDRISDPVQFSSCNGARVLNIKTGKVLNIEATYTILATGGIGSVYGHTTNPDIATGDGIAMAYRAGATISGMEFIQFHPTAFFDGRGSNAFLITEALRGHGAILRNGKGERFMFGYDPRGELASRDIVSRAIHNELKQYKTECVFLDCTHLNATDLKKQFPHIYETCRESGIDLEKHWIPVVPAAHYLCGGIVTDKSGRTSINRLYACGECAHTGLHGANRLASNSLLEALVFAQRIFQDLCEAGNILPSPPQKKWKQSQYAPINQTEIHQQTVALQRLMREHAGIVRNYADLKAALTEIEQQALKLAELHRRNPSDSALCRLRNMNTVARLIVQQSLERKENRGGYYNEDI